MTETRILVVVNDAEAVDAYGAALSELGVAYDVAPTFEGMARLAVEHRYNGLIIDILTLVRCSREEKVIAYDCINFYPVLRIKYEAKHKKIKLSPLEQSFTPDPLIALRSFVVDRCGNFPARRLRKTRRKPLNLNVLLSADGSFAKETTLKAFTVNVSPGGVFLHTMEHYRDGQTLWLRFVELVDQTPVAAKVCWQVRWGEARCIPGVGLRFEGLTEAQEREFQRLNAG